MNLPLIQLVKEKIKNLLTALNRPFRIMQQQNLRVYFCTSNNDFSYILAYILRNPQYEHHVIISGLCNCFEFAKSLNISNTRFIFIETKLKNLRNPLNWILEFINIYFVRRKYLRTYRYSQVYFFTQFYDALVISFVDYLSKRNNIIILGIPMDEKPKVKRIDILTILKSLLYQVKFDNYNLGLSSNFVGLKDDYIKKKAFNKEFILSSELKNVWKQYSIKIDSKDPFFLFLDGHYDYDDLTHASKIQAKSLLKLLETLNTYSKGHPRYGRTDFSKPFFSKTLDSNLPVEFYDLNNCKGIIGFYSFAMVNLSNAGLKVVSLLSLFDYKNTEVKSFKINYLKNSFSDIYFPKSIYEFECFLNGQNKR